MLMALVGMAASLALPGGSARAESLIQALASAYNNNPTLAAERARLRATDEGVPLARADRLPQLSASGEVGVRNQQLRSKLGSSSTALLGGRDGTHHPHGYAFTLTQSLFRGFRTRNALREAEANVLAGREGLRKVEQDTLLLAVTAYMNVVRDQAVVRLRENNVKVLTEQLTATKDRFEVGEVTKTDVAQAEARRAGAVSELDAAQADLKASRAEYERVIGHPPSFLAAPPPMSTRLPRTLAEAIDIGSTSHPEVLQALFLEQAARYAVRQIIGETLPQVSLEAKFSESFDSSLTTRELEETTVTGRLSVPLYSGGGPSARIRAARHTEGQRRRELDAARRQVQADIVSAWSRLEAAKAQIESAEAQVRATRIALNGVREEEKVGQRTILDVLDAEQEQLDAQVTLVRTRRDMV
ncbi:MAG: channel protein TolC, partial [Alphaproteobacteria bacterium]